MPSEYGPGKRLDALVKLNPFSSTDELAASLKADPATIRRLLRIPINGIDPYWTLLPILLQMAQQGARRAALVGGQIAQRPLLRFIPLRHRPERRPSYGPIKPPLVPVLPPALDAIEVHYRPASWLPQGQA